MKKTKEEIDHLKSCWTYDPIWDIEDTEGFEDHYDELKEWRVEFERAEREHEDRRLRSKASFLGCSLNVAKEIDRLQKRIAQLEERNANAN